MSGVSIGYKWCTREVVGDPISVLYGKTRPKTASCWLVRCNRCLQEARLTKYEIAKSRSCRCSAWTSDARNARGEPPRIKHMTILLFGAAPTQLARELENEDAVVEHRKLYCRRMSTCLLYAAERDWQSFSCKSCPVDEHMTLEEIRQDHEGLDEAYRKAEAIRRLDELGMKEKKGVCR